MKRIKKLVFISHCILNQNTVVSPLARAKGAYNGIIKVILEEDIGIHQLPCPEFSYLGLSRKPMTKNQYDNFIYRDLCKNFALDFLSLVKEYRKNSYEIIGLIGINQSPTCSISQTKGIFIEEIFHLLKKEAIEMKLLDIPTDYIEGENGDEFLIELKEFLRV